MSASSLESKPLNETITFKKAHRRSESKLSQISHLSIKSFGDETTDEENEEFVNTNISFFAWMPKLPVPGKAINIRLNVKTHSDGNMQLKFINHHAGFCHYVNYRRGFKVKKLISLYIRN